MIDSASKLVHHKSSKFYRTKGKSYHPGNIRSSNCHNRSMMNTQRKGVSRTDRLNLVHQNLSSGSYNLTLIWRTL